MHSQSDFKDRIIPVMDIMDRSVVHAIAGNRQAYRPIVSRLTCSTDPLDVARAFRELFGFRRIYIALLDRIMQADCSMAIPSWQLEFIEETADDFSEIWIDFGFCGDANSIEMSQRMLKLSHNIRVVVPTESHDSCDQLLDSSHVAGKNAIISLDLKDEQPVRSKICHDSYQLHSILEAIKTSPANDLIALSLDRVGTNLGFDQPLLSMLRTHLPGKQIWIGGGVRDVSELRQLTRAGSAGALVATALHNGSITPDKLSR